MFIYGPTAFTVIWLLLSNYGFANYVSRDHAHGPVVYTGRVAVPANLPPESNPATNAALLQWYAQTAYSQMYALCIAAHEEVPPMMGVIYKENYLYFSSSARDGYGYAYNPANAPQQVQAALSALHLPHNTGSCAEVMTTALYWRYHPNVQGELPGAVMAVYGQREGGTSYGAATPCSGDGATTQGCMQYLEALGIYCEGRNGYGKRSPSKHFVCPRVPIAAKRPAQIIKA